MNNTPISAYPYQAFSPYLPAQSLADVVGALYVVDQTGSAPYSKVYLTGDSTSGAINMALFAYDPINALTIPVNTTPAGALEVSFTAGAATGVSINGTAAASGIIKPANVLSKQVIIQCVDVAETLYVSFNNPATVADIALQPGMSITFNTGVANDIYGLGSGIGAAFSIMELS